MEDMVLLVTMSIKVADNLFLEDWQQENEPLEWNGHLPCRLNIFQASWVEQWDFKFKLKWAKFYMHFNEENSK